MWKWLTLWQERRRRRKLAKILIEAETWNSVSRHFLIRYQLNSDELIRLREIASFFLDEKQVNGAGMVPDENQRVTVAALASLLVLELDLEWYAGWSEVILYPDTFLVHHSEADAAGVVHEGERALAGEAWSNGPVIFSWQDIRRGEDDGVNVVLHEFAHKLDMLDGAADGMPPLHRGMSREQWTSTFQHAFDRLRRRVDAGLPTWLDPYAAENPAEFFAVASEVFFDFPQPLFHHEPALYEQLKLFYRQHPASRRERAGEGGAC